MAAKLGEEATVVIRFRVDVKGKRLDLKLGSSGQSMRQGFEIEVNDLVINH